MQQSRRRRQRRRRAESRRGTRRLGDRARVSDAALHVADGELGVYRDRCRSLDAQSFIAGIGDAAGEMKG
jgi:hypothetical protein